MNTLITEWQSRPRKQIIRMLAASNLDPYDRPAKSALFMPGSRMLCVKECIKSGLIDKSTALIFVERNARVLSNLQRNMAKDPEINQIKRIYLAHTDLSQVSLPKGYPPLDYAFFDFNGTLTAKNAHWISSVLPQMISEETTLSFTLLGANRNNNFAKRLYDLFHKNDIKTIAQKISRNKEIGDHRIAVAIATLVGLLYPRQVGIENMAVYRDTQLMLFIHLRLSGKTQESSLNSLHQNLVRFVSEHQTADDAKRQINPRLLLRHNTRKGASTMTLATKKRAKNVRHNAAAKAWETRRALAKKRSEAAKKAWQTRRTQAG